MLEHVIPSQLVAWLNANQGVVSVSIFMLTLFLGSVTGLFKALRRTPRFKVSLIEGPTFACTFETGMIHANHAVHRTAIALYLCISNVGTAPSDIEKIAVGYHWNIKTFNSQWLRYRIGWFWLKQQIVILDDFHVYIGDQIKLFPFLTQRSAFSDSSSETYLEVGRSARGVVYFEQDDSWGGCAPLSVNKKIRIKLEVTDTFGHRYRSTFWIPSVSLEEARKYNPSFGKTLAQLRKTKLPFDDDSI